jgi:hypothetical protein
MTYMTVGELRKLLRGRNRRDQRIVLCTSGPSIDWRVSIETVAEDGGRTLITTTKPILEDTRSEYQKQRDAETGAWPVPRVRYGTPE